MTEHAHTQVALPLCAACTKPITFYMHQVYDTTTGMLYYHPDCCPDCTRKPTLEVVQ